MGLNDAYFTMEGETSEADVEKVVVDVFKDTPPGDAPELKEGVEFLTVPTEEPTDNGEDMTTATALENACVQLRDLDLLNQQITASGGMSQSIAIESIGIVPSLISDVHPKSFYTTSPTRTGLSYALEAVDEQRQGIVSNISAAISGFLQRAIQWFKNFLSKFNGKAAEKAQQERDAAAQKQRDADLATIATLTEQNEHLRRSAEASDEEFKEQIESKNAQLKNLAAGSNAKILDLTTQMRVLDETKNKEIAQALDALEKLKRSAETSRASRISLGEQVEKLQWTVYRQMVRQAFELVSQQMPDVAKDFRTFTANKAAATQPVAKFLFGNGFQNRMQTLKRTTDAILATNSLVDHLKKLTAAFETSVNNPAGLVAVIGEIDLSHFTSPDQVFQKSEGFEETANAVTPRQLTEGVEQVRVEMQRIASALGNVKLDEMLAQLEKLHKDVSGGVQVPVNIPNLIEVANSHRAMQAHIAKLLPIFTKGSLASADMYRCWSQLNSIQPSVLEFVKSSGECAARNKSVCEAVSRNISLMESFTTTKLKGTVNAIISTKLLEESRK